ncbi:hypothetical protein CXB51_022371 [Gossypium anomalum]|uniref:Integrase catalytic domain-containing protein n=1 Tax=Gossypium anomalum TaxID=47600 RepID=A0A8J6CT09_9ROSI|nr:hypothetical protein CXB51_022371 [Gossypium anomalum]
MAGDGVSTRMQKEMGNMQQEISKIHEEMARLETTMDSKFQAFREEFRGDLHALLNKYFDKGKGVLGVPPGFPQKEGDALNVSLGPTFADMSSVQGKVQSPVIGMPEKYFEAEGIPESGKVRIVMLNLEGRALEWHHFYSQRNGGLQMLSWPAYFKSLQDRFGFGQFGNPMKEIVNLKQQGTVEQYQDMFVGLLNQLHLPESYALSIFLSNLKSEIGHYLDLFEPATLMEAFQLARKIEVLLACPAKKSSTPLSNAPRSPLNLSVISGYSSPSTRSVPVSQSASNATVNKPGTRSIPPAVLAERKQKGLCFWCGAKYQPGHKCVKSQLYQFLWEPLSDSDVEEFQECSNKLEEGSLEEDQSKSPVISLNALNGLQGHNTMRIAARVGSTLAIILVDSGSTHNFIDAKLVNKLSLPVAPQEKLKVTVANGTSLFTRGLCKGVSWEVQDLHLATDFLVLPLKGCDIVLRVQWLLMLGDIIWNFSSLTMQFMVKGQPCTLQGIIPGSLAVERFCSNAKCFVTMGQPMGLYTVVMSTPKQAALSATIVEDSAVHLQEMLDEFGDVFQVPKGLPPSRLHDHRIPLKDESAVIKIRPYRYPAIQKTEIEKIVHEMLQTGIIRNSNSSFASPIVMVKKKDGSWRLCVDYRQLNQHTIKDKFPIPIIEELLDELGEARVFSKLDLRSGYHQIRMCESDIHKTAFRTHEGHYEFLVMPFGLTNAPSSFQALMNLIFKPLLRKCVLLFAKKNKCCLGTTQIEYLGHVLGAGTVSMDQSKIECVSSWPVPKSIKELRSFLGLSGYYRRFIRHYGLLAKPLTELLKKNRWNWSEQASVAFQSLKNALCAAPVLVLPNFQLEFTVDTDACATGVGVVLQQQRRPVAYFSKALGIRHQALSIYEKEMLAVLLAVRKWHAYLVAKMLGYDFEVSYRKGINNGAADALSRQPQRDQGHLFQLSTSSVISDLLVQVQRSYEADDRLKRIIQEVQHSGVQHQKFSWDGRFLRRRRKIVVGKDCQLRHELFKHFHASARCKGETVAYPGLLQSLPVPNRAWSVISLDFIEGLPNSNRKNSILVVVDHLTKYGHFVALSHPYTAKEVAQEFLNNVYKLHGMPDAIISDRDKIFVSTFWQELFRQVGTKLLLSTAYHPQTDGQTEVLNRCLENYLRCMTGETPSQWSQWLPLAEWWYNSSFHSSIQLTPYEALYGQPPPTHMPYLPGVSPVAVVDRSLQAKEAARKLLHFHLKRACAHMKHFADRHRSERSFSVGDLVYLRLQPYRQQTVRKVLNQKLSPKYFRPFPVLKKVGAVAYTLQLPPGSRIHPTFHVSQLKKHIGSKPAQTQLPLHDDHGAMQKEPVRIVDRRIVKNGNQAVTEVLVEWVDSFPEDAT